MRSENPCELLRRCLEERKACLWDTFFLRFGGSIRYAVHRACSRRRSVLRGLGLELDEVLQEVFCRLLADDHAPFEGDQAAQLWRWIERIADHLICDLWRRRQAQKRCPPAQRGEPEQILIEAEAPFKDSSPEYHLLIKEGIGLLLDRCREVLQGVGGEAVLTLVYRAFLEGCTSREIARASGGRWTVRDVNCLLHRLRRGLSARGIVLPRRGGAGQQAPWTMGDPLAI